MREKLVNKTVIEIKEMMEYQEKVIELDGECKHIRDRICGVYVALDILESNIYLERYYSKWERRNKIMNYWHYSIRKNNTFQELAVGDIGKTFPLKKVIEYLEKANMAYATIINSESISKDDYKYFKSRFK